MIRSIIRIFRRSAALGLSKLALPLDRRWRLAPADVFKPFFDGSEKYQIRMNAAMIVLSKCWPYGFLLVKRYVLATVESKVRDKMGFVSGVWAFNGLEGKRPLSPEEIAIYLVKLAAHRKAYLVFGGGIFQFNRRFYQVGLKRVEQFRAQIMTSAE